MSSTADSLKNPAQESATEEPNTKKAKISGKEDDLDDKNVDNNNGTTACEKSKVLDNNNSTSGASKSSGGSSNAKVPSKSANGNDKESKSEQDNSVDGDDDGSGVFDPKIAGKLAEVEDIQSQISKLNELASEEILKVEQKFNKLRRPHFEKRNLLLKEIPNFWLTTLANHPMIASMIDCAEDEDCLHYMVNLDVEEFEDIKSGFKLKFHFVENPYIKNEVIVREVRHVNTDEIVTTASPIEYKDTTQGKNLKQVVDRSIAQHRRKIRPGQTQHSFFAWLSQPETGADEVAETIKDQIWPSPLEYFFAAPDDYGGGSDESDDEDDYDEEVENDADPDVPDEEFLDEELDNEEELDDEDIGDDEEEDEEE